MSENNKICPNEKKCGTCVVKDVQSFVDFINQCNKHVKEERLWSTMEAETVGK